MIAPLDAATVSAAIAGAPSPAPNPADAAVVAELLTGIADTQRSLLRTFWTMAAVYIASVAYALRLGPQVYDFDRFRFYRSPESGVFYGSCLVLVVLFFLWMMSFYLARPRPPTAVSLREYLKTTRWTGRIWLVVYMALWCVWPHQYRLGIVSPTQSTPLEGVAHPIGMQPAGVVLLLVMNALSFTRIAATAARPFEPQQSEVDGATDEGRLRFVLFLLGAYVLALLPAPWLFASVMTPPNGSGFASKGPPLWAYTAMFWAVLAVEAKTARRRGRLASAVGMTCFFIQLSCLAFAALAFATRRSSADPIIGLLGALQIGTMAAACMWLGTKETRTAIAGEAALP